MSLAEHFMHDIIAVIRALEVDHDIRLKESYLLECFSGNIIGDDCWIAKVIQLPCTELPRYLNLELEADYVNFDYDESPAKDPVSDMVHTEAIVKAIILWRIEHQQ